MNHLIYNGPLETLKLYDEAGIMRLHCQARNRTVNEGYGHGGKCPPGDYNLAEPEANTPPIESEGAWFIPLVDTNGLWAAGNRSDIGIHGGGTGLDDPFAPMQGWVETEGCIRLQNEDLAMLVGLVKAGDLLSVLE